MSETLADRARHEIEVKKSRFIVHATPADSPEAALAFLSEIEDRTATHNCWAYRIGQHYRFSDDGEPGGTAGKPILTAIDGQKLDQVMAVVTRHYGGTKLGAGGLMRAYGGSTAECLRRAARRELVHFADLDIRGQFSQLGPVHALLAQFAAQKVAETHSGEGFSLQIRLPVQRVDALQTALRDATRGQIATARR